MQVYQLLIQKSCLEEKNSLSPRFPDAQEMMIYFPDVCEVMMFRNDDFLMVLINLTLA